MTEYQAPLRKKAHARVQPPEKSEKAAKKKFNLRVRIALYRIQNIPLHEKRFYRTPLERQKKRMRCADEPQQKDSGCSPTWRKRLAKPPRQGEMV